MQVCIVDLDGDAASSLADEAGGLAVTADVADPAALDAAFATCVETFGRLDVAYLNAGITLDDGDIASLNVENYRQSLAVNVDHVVFGTSAAVRAMRESPDDGDTRAIVATASLAGVEPFYPTYVYTLTKHAVVGFIRTIAPDLAAERIGAHAICPGITDTGVLSPAGRTTMAKVGITLIEPSRIADAAVTAITSPIDATGTCWVVNHPDQPPQPWPFSPVPGPHTAINVPRSHR
jgi:NAD(P)-dependent dehydrogenase (short-subunit alcohol dehydrogenase family)